MGKFIGRPLRSTAARYGGAVLAGAAALAGALTWHLRPEHALLLFLAVSALSARLGGLGPGLAAAAASAGASLLHPAAGLSLPETLVPLFLAGTVVAILFGGEARESRAQAARAAAALAAEPHPDIESRYHDLLRGVGAIAWEARPAAEGAANPAAFRFTFVSEHVETLLGYPVSDWLGQPGFRFRLVHPDDREGVLAFWSRIAAGESEGNLECRLTAADGSVVWIRDIIQVLDTESGGRRLRGLTLDITDRKRAEETLVRSEEWYRRIVDTATEGILVMDAAAHIVYANGRMAEMLGYLPDELLDRSAYELLFEEDRAEAARILAMLRRGVTEQRDVRLRRKDGASIWVLACTRPIQGEKGAAAGVLAMLTDVSERRRAEEAVAFGAAASSILAASLDYDTTLTSAARLAVPQLADCCIVQVEEEDASVCSAAAHVEPGERGVGEHRCRFPADDAREAVLTHARLEDGPQLFPEVPEWLAAALAADATYAGRGVIEPRSALVVPLHARDRAIGVLILIATSRPPYGPEDLVLAEDLARRVAAAVDNARLYREIQQADQRKEEFLAMLAHELRSPLGAVCNAVAVLRLAGTAAGAGERALGVLERQVAHQVRMVEDLLDVSRITSGKVELRREPLDLGSLIRETAEDHRGAVEAAGLELVLEVPDRPVWVEGDLTRLAQVAGNLLQNAAKFSDAGGRISVSLAVETRPAAADGRAEMAVVRVRDTGMGIEPEVLPHIFEAFAQADQSLDRGRGGLGLGLALVRSLVMLHGGEITAASAGRDRGAEFTFTLPRTADPPEPPAREAADPLQPPHRARRLRVLVVEDLVDAAETMRDLLEMAGHEVQVADSGPAGLEAAARFLPDVILCDIGLPGMDGFEVARRVRAASRPQPLLVAVTGYGRPEDRRRVLDAGFDTHLVKPVVPAELLRILE